MTLTYLPTDPCWSILHAH